MGKLIAYQVMLKEKHKKSQQGIIPNFQSESGNQQLSARVFLADI